MINGILFFENGDVQIVGEIKSARHIITAINTVLPQLVTQEKNAVIEGLSIGELKEILLAKEKEEKKHV